MAAPTSPKGSARKGTTRGGGSQLTLAFLTVVLGCALLIAGFIIPPRGEIDPTVLTAFGETLTFAGALCGIDYHYKFTNKTK